MSLLSLLSLLGVAPSSELVFEFELEVVEPEGFETSSLFAGEPEPESELELELTSGAVATAAAGEAPGCRSGSRQGQSGDLYFAGFWNRGKVSPFVRMCMKMEDGR